MNFTKLIAFSALNFFMIVGSILIWPFFVLKNLPVIIKKGYIAYSIGLFMVILDQWTKVIAVKDLLPYFPKTIFPKLLKLELTKNCGAAFGIMENQQWLFILVAVTAVLVFFLLSARPTRQKTMLYFGYGFLIGGAFGNLLDRLRLDYVIDFIHLRGFPIFNIADISIDIGLGILFWHLIFDKKKEQNYA